MKVQVIRFGLSAVLLTSSLLLAATAAWGQDQGALAATANNGMKAMSNDLAAALASTSESVAKADVRAAITAGQSAIAALRELRDATGDEVVRSRSQAALDQTVDAVNKAQAALDRTGDALRSQTQAALAEVSEAVNEFAPALQHIAPTAVPGAPSALPKTGNGIDQFDIIAAGIAGLSLSAMGFLARRRYAAAT